MMYPNRYEKEPRKRVAYLAVCDLIAVYGVSRSNFDYHRFNLNRVEMKEIWAFAEADLNGKSRYSFSYSWKGAKA